MKFKSCWNVTWYISSIKYCLRNAQNVISIIFKRAYTYVNYILRLIAISKGCVVFCNRGISDTFHM